MRLKVPITGKVKSYDKKLAKLDNIGVSGDSDEPIKLININLGNVSWKLMSIDLENDEAEIEVTPSENFTKDTGQVDGEGKPIYQQTTATSLDKQRFLDEARAKVEGKTSDQLYTETGSPRLKKLKKHVDDYKAYKAEITA